LLWPWTMRLKMDELPELKPLKVSCSDTKCDEGLHCFRPNFKKRKWKQDYKGACNVCGVQLLAWDPSRRRNLADIPALFAELKSEFIRHEFFHRPFDSEALAEAAKRGRVGLRTRVRPELKNGIGAAKPWRDGNQTPMEASAINYGRHATGTCCRKCLEYWYGIARGEPLTPGELDFCEALVLAYLDERATEIWPAKPATGERPA
jgi:hypothetical protein